MQLITNNDQLENGELVTITRDCRISGQLFWKNYIYTVSITNDKTLRINFADFNAIVSRDNPRIRKAYKNEQHNYTVSVSCEN